METTLHKRPTLRLSDKAKEVIVDIIAYLFIALFAYTAYSKFTTIVDFKTILGRSPLIGHYNVVVAWAVPILELAISILLIIPSTKKIGLYLSLLIMIIFTSFLSYGILSGSKLPCHCGGVIGTLSWTQHIWFNLAFISLAITGIKIYKE